MIRKSQLFLAIAALAGMNAAMAACNTSAWGVLDPPPGGAVVGAPVAGDPAAVEVPVYSGACGLQSDAAGEFVQDGSPTAERNYRARFYFRATNSAGEVVVFQAMDNNGASADLPVFKVAYDGAAQQVKFYGGNGAGSFGAAQSLAASRNRWYGVEISYAAGASNNTGTLAASVIGARNFNVPQAGTAAAIAGLSGITVSSGTAGVDYAQFGWVSGAATGAVQVDAFESRRSTEIGFLQRGNTTGVDALCNSDDVVRALRNANAVNGGSTAGLIGTGQPDCSEDGLLNSDDASCAARVANLDNGTDSVCGVP